MFKTPKITAGSNPKRHDTTPSVARKAMSHWHKVLLTLIFLPLLVSAEPGFWHATKGDKSFWIMGSIHVGKEEFYPLPAAIEQAWQKADVLGMEADMRNSTPNEEAAVGSMSRLPAGTSLQQQLPPELYRRAVSQAKKYGLPEQALITASKSWSKRISSRPLRRPERISLRSEGCSLKSRTRSTMRGSVLHHRTGWPFEYQGKMPCA